MTPKEKERIEKRIKDRAKRQKELLDAAKNIGKKASKRILFLKGLSERTGKIHQNNKNNPI